MEIKKVFISLILGIFLISLVSSQLVISSSNQPKEVYNLGDTISISKIKSDFTDSGTLIIKLACGGKKLTFYTNDIQLNSEEEKNIDASLMLTKKKVGAMVGKCKFEGSFDNQEFFYSNNFTISDLITIYTEDLKKEFSPGEAVLIVGKDTKKQNGQNVNGNVSLDIISDTSSKTLNSVGTIVDGEFEINVTIPKEMQAGDYNVKIYAYEKDSTGEITNMGYMTYSIHIKQVPKELEVLVNQSSVDPGKSVQIKTFLYDQTHDKIQSTSIITIKNGKGAIIQQVEKQTGEYFTFTINDKTEEPSEWTIHAVSNKLTDETTFNISEVKEVEVSLENETIFITNIGNVPYDEPVFVNLGNNSITINEVIAVGKSIKHKLKAEQGQYSLNIFSKGQDKFNQSITLTGQTINGNLFKNIGDVNFNLVGLIIFTLLIIAGIWFLIKRVKHRKNFGYSSSSSKPVYEKPIEFTPKKGSLISNSRYPAEVQSSMTGEKQFASVVCVKLKNVNDFSDKSVKDTIDKIVDIAEDSKAFTYDSQDAIFFLLVPSKTKSPENEKTALYLSEKIQNKLKEHNRLFKTKLNFGIAINNGDIACKQNGSGLIFTSTGTLISSTKVLAGNADNEIALGENAKGKLMTMIKTEKKGSISVLKEIKSSSGTNKTFAEGFVKRYKEEQEKHRQP